MLSKADTSIDRYFQVFANTGVNVAFLVPTETGYTKSIMDATSPVRDLLYTEKVHNYQSQKQGPENKAVVPAFFVTSTGTIETSASLYRPVTKHGDPRIWFRNLKEYCRPYNLLALIVIRGAIYVFNLSNPSISESVLDINGIAREIISEARYVKNAIAEELRNKIQEIHNMGYLKSITPGDPGVGDTLENALGIKRNNSKNPDYKGIELKTTRTTKGGIKRTQTRETLFAKVPDEGLKYRQIVETYGKIQIPRDSDKPRLQLYETCRISKPNAYDLQLAIQENQDQLQLIYTKDNISKYVSGWLLKNLKDTLLLKHHETFWVEAASIKKADGEYFQYNKILHTKEPNASLFVPLIEEGKITVDLAAHINPETGKWRDHGMLFKMFPDDLPMLLGSPQIYIL